ncbi:claudin 23a [Betta splendens]|uniref:Claudin 23a n=1 Tax=Betta splendens TaxID=158456 RepID=A0A6P7P2U5_BETSP|nr:claudin 23a [Betta splendens]
MPGRSSQEWVRLSLRTPGILIFGMVLAPCGWILDLTATVAPNWRTLSNLANSPPSQYLEQGVWDICLADTTTTSPTCGQTNNTYLSNTYVKVGQGCSVASLILTIVGLIVAVPGVRCWRDRPNWVVAGLGGILIFCSGVLMIAAVGVYTFWLIDRRADNPSGTLAAGYSIYLGFIGGILEVLGGFVMAIGICRCCGGKNRGEKRVEEVRAQFNQPRPQPKPQYAPRSTRPASSISSSVPYSRDELDDDVSFPRAKSPAARSANTPRGARPYDADL